MKKPRQHAQRGKRNVLKAVASCVIFAIPVAGTVSSNAAAAQGKAVFAAISHAGGKVLVASNIAGSTRIAVSEVDQRGKLVQSFGRKGTATYQSRGHARVGAIVSDRSYRPTLLVNQSSCDVHVCTGGAVVVRFTRRGGLDPTFGGGDGVADVFMSSNGILDVGGLLPLPGGGYLVSGRRDVCVPGSVYSCSSEIIVVKLEANGEPDPSFGSAGTATVPSALVTATPALALDALGRVLVGGPTFSGSQVIRLDPLGGLDPGFSGDGYANVQVPAQAIQVDQSERILVGGSQGHQFGLAALDSAGNSDAGFGAPLGLFSASFGQAQSTTGGFVIQRSGRAVLAGADLHACKTSQAPPLMSSCAADLGLLGVSPTGATAGSFGSNGRLVGRTGGVPIGNGSRFISVGVAQIGNRLIAAGTRYLSANTLHPQSVVILRAYNQAGRPVPRFGQKGLAALAP